MFLSVMLIRDGSSWPGIVRLSHLSCTKCYLLHFVCFWRGLTRSNRFLNSKYKHPKSCYSRKYRQTILLNPNPISNLSDLFLDVYRLSFRIDLLINDLFDNNFFKYSISRFYVLNLLICIDSIIENDTVSSIILNFNSDVWVVIGVILLWVYFIILSAVLIVVGLAFFSVPVCVLHAVRVILVVRKCNGC